MSEAKRLTIVYFQYLDVMHCLIVMFITLSTSTIPDPPLSLVLGILVTDHEKMMNHTQNNTGK